MTLDGSSFLKSVSDDLDKKTAPTTPPPEPPAMSANEMRSRHSQELSAWVENHPDPNVQAVAERWFNGTLTGDDLTKEMPKIQKEFLDHTKTAEAVSKTIAQEALPLMKKHSKEFATLCNLRGDAQMAQMLERGIYNKAFKDRPQFAAMKGHYDEIERSRKEIADADKFINDFREKYGVTETEFNTAMSNLSPDDKKYAMRHFIRSHKGMFERSGYRKDVKNMVAFDFESIFVRRNAAAGKTGTFIESLIKTDPEWQEAMNRALNDVEPVFKEDLSTVQTYENAKDVSGEFDVDSLAAAAETFKTEKLREWGSGPTWKHPGEAAYAEGEFLKEMQKRVGKGFWAKFVDTLLGRNMTDPRIKKIFTK